MATGLPVGSGNMFLSDIGQGPGGATGPKWGEAGFIPDATTVVAMINAAETNNVILCANLAGSRYEWCDKVGTKLSFNQALYESKIRRWTVAGGASQAVADAIAAALASRRMVIYVVDEPFHSIFNGTLPNEKVNWMGLLCKSIWPGCITTVRADSHNMANPIPTGGWSGVDYGWAQYEGPHIPSIWPAIGRSQETPEQFFAREKADFAALDLGMIPAHNLLDGGFYNDFSGMTACWDYGNNGSFGLMKGTFPTGTDGAGYTYATPGTTYACGARPTQETRFFTNPTLMARVVTAAAADPDAPFFNFWTKIYPQFSPQQPFATVMARADIVAQLQNMINIGAARTQWNGWRQAKGTAAPAPGSGGPLADAFAEQTTRQTTTSTTYVDIPGAAIASGSLTTGKTYLISCMAQLDFSDVNLNGYVQALHGTTAFTKSEMCWQPNSGTARQMYHFWTVWTAVAGEGVKLQQRVETGQVATIGADMVSMVAIPISDLPAGSYYFNENTSSQALSTSYAAGASVTFTPDTPNQKWLVLTQAHYVTPSLTQSVVSSCARSGQLTDTSYVVQIEGEDALDQYILNTAQVLSLGAVSQTFTEQSKNTGGGGPRDGSKVFALCLDKFSAYGYAYDAAMLEYQANGVFGTQMQTAQITLTGTKDVFVFGFHAAAMGLLGVSINSRLQVNNTDQVPNQTARGYGLMTTWDATDIVPLQHQTIESLGAGTHTIDLDASVGSIGTGRGSTGRLVVAIALEVPSVNQPPVLANITDKTGEEGTAVTFTASATDPDAGQSVTYSLRDGSTPVPAGASINPSTGAFSWTPTAAQAGVHNFIIRATDNGASPANLYDEQEVKFTIAQLPGSPGPVPPSSDDPSIATPGVVADKGASFLATIQDILQELNALEQLNAHVQDQVHDLLEEMQEMVAYMEAVKQRQA